MTGSPRTSTRPARFLTSRFSRPRAPRVGALGALRRTTALTALTALVGGCGVLPGSGPDRSPVTVMTWAPERAGGADLPGIPAMARAFARWVNAEGGIGGRELEVITCNERNDAAGASECAHRAVAEEAVAVVGSYSQHSRAFLGPLESAGIPYIGGYGVTEDEFTRALSYPVHGGQPALTAGLGRQLAAHCTDVALVRPDTSAGDELPVLLNGGLATGRRPAAHDVMAAEEATEYTRQAREALSRVSAAGPGKGCVVSALGDRTRTFTDSFRRVRADYPPVRVGAVFGSVDQSAVDRTGGGSGPYEGAYVCGWYPVSSDPRWAPMRKVIGAHAFDDNRIDPADAGVQTTWVAYTVLREAVEAIGGAEVTARGVRDVLDGGLRVDTGGLTPVLSWRFEDLLAVREFPRAVNANVTFQSVRDGRLVAARPGFVDVSATLEDLPAR
ncbi:ABC transporter substrate-binding protein [Streptomyces sp. NPDC049906]|uniref:ABC transporter substrate-binding protein n=1 Tax=Streptomyces sp. NPDC049906 TaxID=3155656 RepID=UPI00343E00D7